MMDNNISLRDETRCSGVNSDVMTGIERGFLKFKKSIHLLRKLHFEQYNINDLYI